MSADGVLTAALSGIAADEVVIAPGIENAHLLEDVFRAEMAAFGGHSAQLVSRFAHT
jgi:hypothetical protein